MQGMQAFSDPAALGEFVNFLRQKSSELAARAVVSIVPKARVAFPQVKHGHTDLGWARARHDCWLAVRPRMRVAGIKQRSGAILPIASHIHALSTPADVGPPAVAVLAGAGRGVCAAAGAGPRS